ncbi:MAG TPA: hypothetical protein VF035_06965 [Longimicrobiales bacterium]
MRPSPLLTTRRAAVLLAAALATACSSNIPHMTPSDIPDPAPADVESVLFLIGDAGNALANKDPVMRKMQADVEYWAGALRRDSSVVVLYLGDNVYPAGVHDQTDPEFPRDSAIMQAQVDIVNGPNAVRRGVRGIFVAGNHDWGQAAGLGGAKRLQNQEDLLNRMRARGTPVWLFPKAGTPGPHVFDVGQHLRILLLDTAWWLLTGQDTSKAAVYNDMRRAFETAGDRNVIVGAHHPFRSASSHGGLMPFWSGLGIRYLLNRSGAVLQDLSSIPYKSLTQAFEAAFAGHPPLLFAGGHDHNLQVLRGLVPEDPQWMVVSGAGSKTDDLGYIDGMQFRHGAAGYMRVMIHGNGRADLFVIAAPGDKTPTCEQSDAAERERCMVTTAEQFDDVYSVRMK